MCIVLGFLGTAILLLSIVNHAHADTARADAEMLQTGVMIAGKVESSSLGLAHRDSTQGDGEIEAVADRADNVGAIDNSQGKKRRVFLSISIESGGAYINADWGGSVFDFRTGRYVEVSGESSYDPMAGWSVQVGRDPVAIEVGWERIFYLTSKETVFDSFFLGLKCNVGTLKQFPIWAGIGVNRVNLMNSNGLGFHLKVLFFVKRWTKSEMSFDIGYRHMISATAFSPGGSGVSEDYKIISAAIQWTYLIYESPIR